MADDILLDAGLFIGALLKNDPRHAWAVKVVNGARLGHFSGVTTIGILSETYAALTWEGAVPPHAPDVAAQAVLAIVEAPSQIRLLGETADVLPRMLAIAKAQDLRARRVHDARHAATALVHGVCRVATYDQGDWSKFASHGIVLVNPETLATSSQVSDTR